jgi:hypothetical protein
MSIIYCEKHDRRWDSDFLMECPGCECETVPCTRCNGTGAIDAPFSGSDPSCPECDGEGVKPA